MKNCPICHEPAHGLDLCPLWHNRERMDLHVEARQGKPTPKGEGHSPSQHQGDQADPQGQDISSGQGDDE